MIVLDVPFAESEDSGSESGSSDDSDDSASGSDSDSSSASAGEEVAEPEHSDADEVCCSLLLLHCTGRAALIRLSTRECVVFAAAC